MTDRRSLKYALASRCLYEDWPGDKKKSESTSLLNVFLRLGLTHYKIIEGESPDFLVTFSRGQVKTTIGYELTGLYSDSTIGGSQGKRDFEVWKIIAKKLRKRLDRAGHEHLYGVLYLKGDEGQALKCLGNDGALEELERVCDLYSQNYTDIVFPRSGFPLLNSSLAQVRLFKYDERDLLWWCAHFQSGEVSDPTSALIETVKAKTKRAEKYLWKGADEKWLVIVAESNGLIDLAANIADPEISKHVSPIGFTRIILWERWNEDVIQLFPAFTKFCDGIAMRCHLEHFPEILLPFATGGTHYPTKVRGS